MREGERGGKMRRKGRGRGGIVTGGCKWTIANHQQQFPLIDDPWGSRLQLYRYLISSFLRNSHTQRDSPGQVGRGDLRRRGWREGGRGYRSAGNICVVLKLC